MKKTFAFGICAVAALALTAGGCSKNSECATACKDKEATACCEAGKKNADACCKGDTAKSCCQKSGASSDNAW